MSQAATQYSTSSKVQFKFNKFPNCRLCLGTNVLPWALLSFHASFLNIHYGLHTPFLSLSSLSGQMCICTFSRCIILPAKYALNPKCCHWRQHGRPGGFSASPSEPNWKHFLTMLRAWAGAFKCLLRACAGRFVSQIVKLNRPKVAVKGKMCRERTCSMWYTNMDVLTITMALSR